jgi:hypothetical protein
MHQGSIGRHGTDLEVVLQGVGRRIRFVGLAEVLSHLYGRKPIAQSKEGTNMRINSIHEVNTHQEQNPFVSQTADSTARVKEVSKLSFEDYLKSYCQQMSVPVTGNSAEHRITSIYGGFFLPPVVRTEREPTLKSNAS